MPLILRRRASALASLLAITTFPAAARPLDTPRSFGELLDGANGAGFTEPRTLFSRNRQRRADIFDRLEL